MGKEQLAKREIRNARRLLGKRWSFLSDDELFLLIQELEELGTLFITEAIDKMHKEINLTKKRSG